MARAPKRRHGKRMRLGRYDPHYYTRAGPVTVRQADGTTTAQEALDRETYALVVKERWGIPAGTRSKVWKRDRGRCRYCGSEDELQVDHVVPVALGGSNRLGNLVLACRPCNARKGTDVWKPRPITP